MESSSNQIVYQQKSSSSISLAFVCTSGFFCVILIFCYWLCYCHEPDQRYCICCFFKKLKPKSPLLLPVVSYSKRKNLTQGCVVCLSEFDDREEVKLIPACGHVFHPECIDMWLQKHVSCPVCRCEKMFAASQIVEEEDAEDDEEGGVIQFNGDELMERRLGRSRSWCECNGVQRMQRSFSF